jgi:GTP-binding protein Era
MKSGFVAIIGRPNAGKSTLMNSLIESKISIISPKAQTTRNAIRGILTEEDSQIVFVDTPGIHKPQHALGEQMNKEATSNMSGVDIIYYIVDATQEFGGGEEYIIRLIKNSKLPVFLLMNKIDCLSRDQIMDKLIQYSRKADFKEIIPISALKNDNLDELLKTTKEYLEDGIQYYPSDQICDYPEQFIISELIREKVLILTSEEIPHSVAVVIEKIGRQKGKLFVMAMIIVERNSQKGIIIGKQGRMVKEIGTLARQDIQGILGESIYLELFVRVEKDWRNKKAKLQQLGYIPMEIDNG